MKEAGVLEIILMIVKLVGCPLARKQCPKWGIKQEDCDSILNTICP